MDSTISGQLISVLTDIQKRELNNELAIKNLKSLWSELTNNKSSEHIQKAIITTLNKKALLILDAVKHNRSYIDNLRDSLLNFGDPTNSNFAITELKALAHFIKKEYREASGYFESIPLEKNSTQ